MADLFENPMGLMGFEFVEFASPTPNFLEPAFERLVDQHRHGNGEVGERVERGHDRIPERLVRARRRRSRHPQHVERADVRDGCEQNRERGVRKRVGKRFEKLSQ